MMLACDNRVTLQFIIKCIGVRLVILDSREPGQVDTSRHCIGSQYFIVTT